MYPETYVIPQNKNRLLMVFALCIIMILGACYVLFDYPAIVRFFGSTSYIIKYVGVFCIIYFSGIGAYVLYRIASNSPVLSVSREGFSDTSTLGAPGRVEWSEVESISVETMMKQKFISVRLKDFKAFIARKPWYVRMLSKGNKTVGLGAITINLKTSSEKPKAVAELMNSYFEQWQAGQELR